MFASAARRHESPRTWQAKANQNDKFIANFTLTGTAIGWPKAQETKVELRDVYVIDLVPTAEMRASYCYSHRVLYLDKDLAYTADQADTSPGTVTASCASSNSSPAAPLRQFPRI